MKVTVLGATGGIGRAICERLGGLGHEITQVSRSGRAVVPGHARSADLHDADATRHVCAGADVVVMAAQPPYPQWVDHWPVMLRTVIDATEASGSRLVMVDNLYAYAPAIGPLNEDHPQHAADAKGRVRIALLGLLRTAHARGRIRMTVGQFSDYYGPHGTNSGLYMLGIKPALAGRRPRGLVDLDQPHTFHYLPDAARGFATLTTDDRADGHTWVLPAAPPITQRELLGLVSRETGAPEPGVVPRWMLRVAGLVNPMVREMVPVAVQYDRPWVVDASRFTSTFGEIEVTPHDRAVAETVAAFRRSAQEAAAD